MVRGRTRIPWLVPLDWERVKSSWFCSFLHAVNSSSKREVHALIFGNFGAMIAVSTRRKVRHTFPRINAALPHESDRFLISAIATCRLGDVRDRTVSCEQGASLFPQCKRESHNLSASRLWASARNRGRLCSPDSDTALLLTKRQNVPITSACFRPIPAEHK